MKKLFIIIPSLIMLLLFIVLNYLLWDRQNKIVEDSSNDATIAALGREIKNMEASESLLRDYSNKLDSDLKIAQERIKQLSSDKIELQTSVAQKDEIIGQLKQSADLSSATSILNSWLDNFSKGQFDNAFQLQTSTAFGQELAQEEFSKQCKSKIKNFKLTATPVLQPITEGNKGDIVYIVPAEIERNPDSGKFIFEEGKNERLVTLIFSKEKNSWLISKID